MNVAELKKALAPFEDDAPVYLASDEEGNRIHVVDSATLENDITIDGAWPLVLWPGKDVTDEVTSEVDE